MYKIIEEVRTATSATLYVQVPGKLTQKTLDAVCERAEIYSRNTDAAVTINLIRNDDWSEWIPRPMSHN